MAGAADEFFLSNTVVLDWIVKINRECLPCFKSYEKYLSCASPLLDDMYDFYESFIVYIYTIIK